MGLSSKQKGWKHFTNRNLDKAWASLDKVRFVILAGMPFYKVVYFEEKCPRL